MAKPRRELSDLEKLAKKIGPDWEDVLKELEASSVEELNKRIAQSSQSISDTKLELDENQAYQKAKNDVKLLSSSFREVKARQGTIIKVSLQLRREKGAT